MTSAARTATPAPPETLADEARALLAQLADPQRAVAMQAYMRGLFPFFGVGTPARRAQLKPWLALVPVDAAPATAEALWRLPERECQLVACDLLARHARKLPAECMPRLARLVVTRAWWDTVDTLASKVYGPMALRHPECLAALDACVAHEDLWLRRVALIYQLSYGEATDTARLQTALDANLAHPDFFIRKAMGWALRQYARTDPDWVRDYLQSRGARVPPLTRREALRHL
ncbi:DNA alkylation repair protein [Niveibacterium sp. SC-1]|uniref:DNA alkylation repair protein n=1 Tax=Niveibacterium sp. SC-1 TaxID=3135646 RepID=UPI00311E32E0